MSEKIINAYKGYEGWRALRACISEDWFNPKDTEILAENANAWRNELAHEKRDYHPDINTVKSIRFVEHLNYAIVMRELGYEDAEIQKLLDQALIR